MTDVKPLETTDRDDEARAEAERRFFTAREKRKPEDLNGLEAGARVDLLKAAIVDLATLIGANVPEGRNKSLALTALEDVQMRANRGIFGDGAAR